MRSAPATLPASGDARSICLRGAGDSFAELDQVGAETVARIDDLAARAEAQCVGLDRRLHPWLVEVMGLEPTTSSMRPKRCHMRRTAVTWAYGRRAVTLPGSRALSVP